jgi:hypothetical protein
MNITRTSKVSGVTRSREIDITPEQLASWESGTLIQNAAPHLSVSEREFIMSGITDDEWDSVFGKSDKKEGDEDESL